MDSRGDKLIRGFAEEYVGYKVDEAGCKQKRSSENSDIRGEF